MGNLNWPGISAVITIFAAVVLVLMKQDDDAQVVAIIAIALAVLSLHRG